jgi:hypothetical protein
MINLTSPHNWVALAAMILLIGIVAHVVGRKVAPVGKVVSAAFGS